MNRCCNPRISWSAGLILLPLVLIALLTLCGRSIGQNAATEPASRRVWAFSDSHIGLGPEGGNDGKPGVEWFQLALADLTGKMGGADFVLGLGDLINSSQDAELQQYIELRSKSNIKTWFEINGNHDFAATTHPAWRENIHCPGQYVVEDGNCAYIMFSSQQSAAAGRIYPDAFKWLKASIEKYQDHNIIVCTHQPVNDTVSSSTRPGRHLYLSQPTTERAYEDMLRDSKTGTAAFDQLLADSRVDLWLCGHIHGGHRSAAYVAHRGATTFINVSATGHAYGTQMSCSYLLEFTQGSKTLLARCRNHDDGVYIADQEAKIELPYAVHLSATGPHVIPEPVTQPATAGAER